MVFVIIKKGAYMKTGLSYEMKEEFLSKAFAYLVEHGLEDTHVRALGKEVCSNYSSLYRYFDDKDDCLVEAVKFGLEKVSDALFSFALKNFSDFDVFFCTLLDEVKKYQPQLRTIYQMVASPVYGDKIRATKVEFEKFYTNQINKLAEMLGCDTDTFAPFVYNTVSIILSYVLWDSREIAEVQLKDLRNTIEIRFRPDKHE